MRTAFSGILMGAVACFAFAATSIAADSNTKAPKKPASACVGLDNAACGGKDECIWFKQITMKNGKTRKAHCRKKSTRTAASVKKSA